MAEAEEGCTEVNTHLELSGAALTAFGHSTVRSHEQEAPGKIASPLHRVVSIYPALRMPCTQREAPGLRRCMQRPPGQSGTKEQMK